MIRTNSPTFIILLIACFFYGCSVPKEIHLQEESKGGDSQPTYLGIAIDEDAYSLEAGYTKHRLSKEEHTEKKIKSNAQLNGFDIAGNIIQLKVNLTDHDQFDPDYSFPDFKVNWITNRNKEKDSWLNKDDEWGENENLDASNILSKLFSTYRYENIVLFWSGSSSVKYIDKNQVTISNDEMKIIHNECDRLWNEARRDLIDKNIKVKYKISRKEFVIPKGEKYIASLWMQAEIDNTDYRGSFFILYNLNNKSILYSTFGHPEWTPESNIKNVRPYIWFKIGDDPRTFM